MGMTIVTSTKRASSTSEILNSGRVFIGLRRIFREKLWCFSVRGSSKQRSFLYQRRERVQIIENRPGKLIILIRRSLPTPVSIKPAIRQEEKSPVKREKRQA